MRSLDNLGPLNLRTNEFYNLATLLSEGCTDLGTYELDRVQMRVLRYRDFAHCFLGDGNGGGTYKHTRAIEEILPLTIKSYLNMS